MFTNVLRYTLTFAVRPIRHDVPAGHVTKYFLYNIHEKMAAKWWQTETYNKTLEFTYD